MNKYIEAERQQIRESANEFEKMLSSKNEQERDLEGKLFFYTVNKHELEEAKLKRAEYQKDIIGIMTNMGINKYESGFGHLILNTKYGVKIIFKGSRRLKNN